jgi:isoquinoline 1-oxidoreductase beta subunit
LQGVRGNFPVGLDGDFFAIILFIADDALLFERITLEDGRVVQGNFDDYRIARMRDTPEINVTIVQSDAAPTGTGNSNSPIVPAITNAIFAATGVRIRKLPIGRQKLV